jgi:hypothetical protein
MGLLVALFLLGIPIFIIGLFIGWSGDKDKNGLATEISKLKNDYQKILEIEETEKKENYNLKAEVSKLNEILTNNKSENYLYKQRINKFEQENKDFRARVMNELQTFLTDKSQSFKWLAGMIADYMTYAENHYNLKLFKDYLEEKPRAVKIKDLTKDKHDLIVENRILKYQLEHIKALIPDTDEIIEYTESSSNASDDFDEKEVFKFLSKEEYNALSDTEKNEHTLEYYRHKHKSKWEIGRDFERYIGYLFEQEGFKVEYFGMEEGFNDFGRDLIVKDNYSVKIIQCKYWSKKKIIHEKHINQLFGTVTKYRLENPKIHRRCEGIFVTHTVLSDTAKKFAEALGIQVQENIEIGNFPIIKCHVGKEGKIYHLPMDQQYNKTKIQPEDGDMWATTIAEAEEHGFRRAHRWHVWGELAK